MSKDGSKAIRHGKLKRSKTRRLVCFDRRLNNAQRRKAHDYES